jgi:hypothetical protein
MRLARRELATRLVLLKAVFRGVNVERGERTRLLLQARESSMMSME